MEMKEKKRFNEPNIEKAIATLDKLEQDFEEIDKQIAKATEISEKILYQVITY